jgi:hypothetical protein
MAKPTNRVYRDDVLIRYVKKAGMYCKTSWVDGIQKQEWLSEKEDAKENN